MISFIVAMDKNNVIGHKNKMPWHLPNDLRFFKEKTTGHTIAMGRKTFESIGRVLPKRKHIVITSRSDIKLPEEVEAAKDIQEIVALDRANREDELFVIGGGIIFEQMLPYADRLYVTVIDESFDGDVFFPEISPNDWVEVSREKGIKNEANPYDYYFLEYIRKN